MRLFSILGLLGLGVVSFGGWYKFHALKPKILKEYLEWSGFKVDIHNDNTWLAILDEHKDVVSRVTNKVNPNIQDIQNWCKDNLVKEDYEELKEDASKICVNNPQTVRAKIIQQDGNINSLIESSQSSKDEEYKVSYIFRKHISGVLTLINFVPPEQEEGKPIEENIKGGGKALEAWCRRSLDAKPDDALVANVKLLCSPKGFKTIKELINKQGENDLLLTNNENSEDLDKKYEAIRQLDSWTKDDSKVQNKVDKDDLKKWCEAYEKKNFFDEGVFSNDYPKFRFRCLKSTKAEG